MADGTEQPRGPAQGPRDQPLPAVHAVRGAAGEGGDPACWLERVCPECGRIADAAPPVVCERCGTLVEG
jgi:hypothetical protein